MKYSLHGYAITMYKHKYIAKSKSTTTLNCTTIVHWFKQITSPIKCKSIVFHTNSWKDCSTDCSNNHNRNVKTAKILPY